MSIRQDITGIKKIFAQGSDLLLLRLRVLRLDLEEQAAGVLKIAAVVAAAAVLCLVALIAALFGLNTVLPPEAKVWTFFGITAGALLVVLILLMQVSRIWRNGRAGVSQTLQDMQGDLLHLRGQIDARSDQGEQDGRPQ